MAAGLSPIIWARPIRLFDVNRTKQLLSAPPLEAGVYRIRVLDADEQPRPLRRLNGDDPEGILDIGEAGKTGHTYVRWRIEAFQNAVLNGTTYHAAGLKFHHYRNEVVFPLYTLWVDWVIKLNKDAAKACEKKLLHNYRCKFLDQPPLNSQA